MNKGMRYEDLVLIKTAGEMKDKDYDIKVPAAGADTPVEDSGYDLVEGIAHPGQVQVSNSFRNDGIVENGVEKQKAMVDVAIRNPRGVLAELMKSLVKAANALENDMTDESIKMAAEIDSLLVKMAQQSLFSEQQSSSLLGSDTQFDSILQAAKNVIVSFDKLTWHGLASRVGSEESEQSIEKVKFALQRYMGIASNMKTPAKKLQWAEEVAGISKQFDASVRAALEEARTTTLGGLLQAMPIEQKKAWNDFVMQSETIQAPSSPSDKPQHPQEVVEERKLNTPTIPKERAGLSNRTPGAHHYSVSGPDVEALQKALGLSGDDVDGKFGPKTYEATMARLDQMQPNNGVRDLPQFQSYSTWTNKMVEAVTQAVEKHSEQQNISSNMPGKDGLIDPYTPDANKTTQSNNDLAWQDFKDRYRPKYKDIEVENGLVYPFGMEDGRKYRVTSDGRWQKA
jgi:hypothetical protein